MPWIRKLTSSTALRRLSIITAGKVVAAILQAFTIALVARALGLTSFGEFSIGYSAILMLMVILEFGFGNRALRVMGENEPNRLATTIIIIRSATDTLVIVVAAVVLSLIGFLPGIIALMLVVYTTGELFATLSQSMLVGFFREKASIASLLLRRVLTLGAMFWVLLDADGHRELLVYAVLGGSGAVGYAISFAQLAPHAAKPLSPFALILENRRFWISSVSNNLQRADTLVIGALGSTALAGLYSAAVRLTSPLNLLTGSILQSVMPSMSVAKNQDARRLIFGKVLKAMTCYAALLMLGSALAPLVIRIMYGEEYVSAAPIAVAVFLVAGMNAVIQALLAWYYSSGLPSRVPVFLAMWTVFILISVAAGAILDSATIIALGLVASAVLVLGLFFSTFPWRREEPRRIG